MKRPLFFAAQHPVRVVVLGYAVLLILIALSSFLFISLERSFQQTTSKLYEVRNQKDDITLASESARTRSLLLIRMINSNDPFEIDQLQQEMRNLSLTVTHAFRRLQSSLEPTYQNDFNALLKITTGNRDLQEQVYQYMINDQPEDALRMFIDNTLPMQERAINSFGALQIQLNNQASETEQTLNQLIKTSTILWFSVAFVFAFSLILIGLFTIKRLQQLQHKQSQFHQTLENKVQKRTQELHLDRSVLHNIQEAVAVGEQNGHLVKTNQQFDYLVSQTSIQSHNLWEVLHALMPQTNIENFKQKLLHSGQIRENGQILIKDRLHYFFVDIFCVEDAALPEKYISVLLTDVSELKLTQQNLEQLANFDPVTQLRNRHAFQEHLTRAVSNPSTQNMTLFYIDLDNFKWINDTLGHDIGDQFLYQIGQQFTQRFEQNKFMALYRLGGDEFALLAESCDENDLTLIADQIFASTRQANVIQKTSQPIGCSIGVVSYPEDTHTAESLLKYADFAMYKAKELGKNQVCFFSENMNQQIHYLYDMEKDLKKALEQQALFMHYQPQYNLHNGLLTGAEALIRWQNNDQMVSPAEFIPLAERFGLIHAIGEFVMKTAVNQLVAWQTPAQTLPRMAVNISSAQLNTGNFANAVAEQLKQLKIRPQQLDFEITETVLMENVTYQKNVLETLQKQGFEISIDDFGTGYSSLAYIKHLSVDRIKIDQSFVQDLGLNQESDSIVSAIITMGHNLGLKVLAEGIETPEQLAILRELGCDEGQGYYLSRPKAHQDFPFAPLNMNELLN